MTFPAEQLEVVEAQRDLRTPDRYRIQLDFVMHYLARLIDPAPQTILAEVMRSLCVFVPAILPGFRAVESPSELLSHG